MPSQCVQACGSGQRNEQFIAEEMTDHFQSQWCCPILWINLEVKGTFSPKNITQTLLLCRPPSYWAQSRLRWGAGLPPHTVRRPRKNPVWRAWPTWPKPPWRLLLEGTQLHCLLVCALFLMWKFHTSSLTFLADISRTEAGKGRVQLMLFLALAYWLQWSQTRIFLVILMLSEQNREQKGAMIVNTGRCEICFLSFQPISLRWGKRSSIRRLPYSFPITLLFPRIRTSNTDRKAHSLKRQGDSLPHGQRAIPWEIYL